MAETELADFLRSRRAAMQPSDVGLGPGARRRTPGLRREEVALLAGVSADYYARLEQSRGTVPSLQVLGTLSRALRLDLDERDHLHRLAGQPVPPRTRRERHVPPGLMRVLDRLDDTPAQVVSDLGDTLAQNRMAVALLGDQTAYSGPERSLYYRWFAGPCLDRDLCPARLHERTGEVYASHLRTAIARGGEDARTRELVGDLLETSEEFARVWARHEVGHTHDEVKELVHPRVGELRLSCERLSTQGDATALLIFTAPPGSEAAQRLSLLAAIGTQSLLEGR